MQTIRPALLKPGVAFDSLPMGEPTVSDRWGNRRLIRGRALIFWDLKQPGGKYRKKLDAIDTDQITPAADCVSREK